MSELNYPRVVVGAFIFNENDELFLMKSPKWKDQYTVPGGGVDFKESIDEALKREVKEETNMDISFEGKVEVKEAINSKEYKKHKHLIMIDCKARVKGKMKVKLNEEGTEFKWKKPSDWLNEKGLEPITRGIIEKHFVDTESIENKYLRALADYQNLQKRALKEKEELARYATEQVVHEIIPVYDNLKLALLHSGEADSNNWLEGVGHIVRQFQDILKNLGVTEISPQDDIFNYEEMEAIDKLEAKNEEQDGKIARVAKVGYKLKDRVIIPARVVVYEFKKSSK